MSHSKRMIAESNRWRAYVGQSCRRYVCARVEPVQRRRRRRTAMSPTRGTQS